MTWFGAALTMVHPTHNYTYENYAVMIVEPTTTNTNFGSTSTKNEIIETQKLFILLVKFDIHVRVGPFFPASIHKYVRKREKKKLAFMEPIISRVKQ